ncbi:MAG: hypothetical protein JSV88_23750, partial [Candidatus Aminicenantes bacterium]
MNTKHPELKQLFHCGRFPSYIRTLCDQLENCLKNQDNTQLESLLNSVYENSELLDFFDHYSAFIPTMDLYRRVLIIKRKLALQHEITAEIKTGTKTVLESLENYLAPPSPGNFENETLKYMILPTAVQLQPNEKPTAVLHYIYYEPAAVPDDQWLANQFYSFKDQPQAIEYFETLVDEIKVNLFFQKRPGVRSRIDIPEIRWPHYGILFDHQVVGRTYGGALMILMLLGYMETLCGSKGHGFGGYAPGTMIQAVIEPDGTLKPTNHPLIKTDTFLNEYDTHDVRLIFAEGSQEELGLKYQQGKFIIGNHSIARDKVIFVKNTGEL